MQVKRKELTPIARKFAHRKTEGFRKMLWEISLDAIDSKIKSLQESENPSHPNIIEGLSQIISTLDIFWKHLPKNLKVMTFILKFTMQSIK